MQVTDEMVTAAYDRYSNMPYGPNCPAHFRLLLEAALADVLWYLVRVATLQGITLQEIANANLTKLKARYPEGFVPGGGVR